MKHCYIPKSFGTARLQLLETCDEIIEDYQASGYTLTTRQLYYQLVAKDLIPNTVKSYNRIKSLISEARLAGLLDWDAIEDRGRVVHLPGGWDTPQAILRGAAYGFRINRWEFQPVRIIVMVEKQALEGVLDTVCSKWGVSFVANKGYASSTLLYQEGRKIKTALEAHKIVRVLYLGDHDPSGLDMDRDIYERLWMFSEGQEGLFREDTRRDELTVTRLALTQGQIQQYNPPPNPAKMTDARAAEYIKQHGNSSWELDALAPNLLEQMVGTAIDEIITRDGSRLQWDESIRMEANMRTQLESFCDDSLEEPWFGKRRLLHQTLEALLLQRREKMGM